MDIHPSEIPEGFDYQLIVTAVYGDSSFNQIGEMEKTGWRKVPRGRHPNLTTISGRWIENGGLVLMERPKFLTDRAKTWEQDKADAQLIHVTASMAQNKSPLFSDGQYYLGTSRRLNLDASSVRKTTIKEWFIRNWWVLRVWCRNNITKEAKS